jgi:hypothetical protein
MRNHHHRRCRSNGGGGGKYKGEKFIVFVDAHRHALWHQLFQNMTPEEIIRDINKQWLDPRFELQLTRR